MAGKTYIKDLTNKSNPSLSGYTVYEDGLVTYKTTLESIKTTIGSDYVVKPTTNNTNFGVNTFQNIQGGAIYNTSFGYESLKNLTTGDGNVGYGTNTLYTLTEGLNNTAVGTSSLRLLLSGSNNITLGSNSLEFLTTGSRNFGGGTYSMYSSTVSSDNVSIGHNSLYNMTGGTYNISIGSGSGSYGGIKTINQGIFIGGLSRPKYENSTNEIAIGYNVIGNGSNTITIGNDFNNDTILNGNINVKTKNIDLTYSSIDSGSTGTTIIITNGNFTKFNVGDRIDSYFDGDEVVTNAIINSINGDNNITVSKKLCTGNVVDFDTLSISRNYNRTNIISSTTGETITIGNHNTTTTINGSVSTSVSIVTGDTILDKTHNVILVNTSGSTIYIPSPFICQGRQYVIKNISTEDILLFIESESAKYLDNIDISTGGITGYALSSMSKITIVSDGTKWWTI